MNLGRTLQEFPRWSVDDLKRDGWLLVERFGKGQNAHGLIASFRKGKERAGIMRQEDGFALVEVQL
jgi:hypothetical protein